MKLKKALKRKNMLIGQINMEYHRLNKYNTVDRINENNRPYKPLFLLENIRNMTDELIDLKSRIQKTNKPVHNKVFRLSELKTMVKKLNDLSCEDGKEEGRWGERDKFVVSEIGVAERDKLVQELWEEIEQLQDDLDYWNQVTDLVE